jgi:ABC-2 type transport system ATP-binding protein
MNEIIKFSSVVKKYKKFKALDGLSFTINEGSCTALIGNNGCGKTTTIYTIGNIISYDDGQYFYKEKLVTPKYVSYKNQLGMILSEPYYIEDFSIETYWKFVAKFQKVPKNEINGRIENLLELLELQNERNKKIKELSSGNQMKVTFGSAIIHNPQVLILDEPFINLDIKTVEKLLTLLKSLKGDKTIFITSHNLDMVAELCDNFLIMDRGKIIEQFNNNDFKTIEALKESVKTLLRDDDKNAHLSWLK